MIWPTCLLGWAAHSRASAECWSQCRLALRPEAKCPVNVDEMRAPDLPPNSVPHLRTDRLLVNRRLPHSWRRETS
jgi:hypothetical protein